MGEINGQHERYDELSKQAQRSTAIFAALYGVVAVAVTTVVFFASSTASGSAEKAMAAHHEAQERLAKEWVWEKKPQSFDYMWRVPR